MVHGVNSNRFKSKSEIMNYYDAILQDFGFKQFLANYIKALYNNQLDGAEIYVEIYSHFFQEGLRSRMITYLDNTYGKSLLADLTPEVLLVNMLKLGVNQYVNQTNYSFDLMHVLNLDSYVVNYAGLLGLTYVPLGKGDSKLTMRIDRNSFKGNHLYDGGFALKYRDSMTDKIEVGTSFTSRLEVNYLPNSELGILGFDPEDFSMRYFEFVSIIHFERMVDRFKHKLSKPKVVNHKKSFNCSENDFYSWLYCLGEEYSKDFTVKR